MFITDITEPRVNLTQNLQVSIYLVFIFTAFNFISVSMGHIWILCYGENTL